MYETHENLTEWSVNAPYQWQVIKNIVDDGRKRKVCLKRVVDACLWLTRTGSQWRNLSQTQYPAWQTIAYYFYKWQHKGVWQQLREILVKKERQRQRREAQPSRIAIDSQSVKQCGCFSGQVGVDGNKKIDGRKRHLAVDSLGLPWAMRIPHRVRWSAHVGAANEADAIAGFELLPQLKSKRLTLICADAAYRGDFEMYAHYYGWKVDISQKPPSKQGFIPQKGRWQVERSFAWLNHYRRLAKEYERTTASAVSFIELAFINIILSTIA